MLKKIESFQVNHLNLPAGLYVSRQDGDITTYDLRFCRPNVDAPLASSSMHTLEHLGATCARSGSFAPRVIYFGPMGCRTGFYLLVRDMTREETIALVQEIAAFAASFTGEIPGASAAECGNFSEHDLAAAKSDAEKYGKIIAGWSPEKCDYPAE